MNEAYVAAVAVNFAMAAAVIAMRRQHRTMGDWWSPPMLLSYTILIGAPGALLLALDPSSVYTTIERTNAQVDPYVILGLTGLYSVALTIAQFFGTFSRHAEKTGRQIGFQIEKLSPFTTPEFRDSARLGTALIVLGLVGWMFMLQQIGGLGDLWSDIQQRTRLTSGLGYLITAYRVSILLGMTLILHYATAAWRHAPTRRIILVISLVLTASFVMVSLGGRGGLLGVGLTLFLSQNYWRGVVRPFSPRVTSAGLLVLALVLLLGLPRLPEIEIENFVSDTDRVIGIVTDQALDSLAFRTTATQRNATMVAYFSRHDVWLGRGYFSLITAPVPRGVAAEKPPVDDGIYVFNMSFGAEIEPNQDLSNYRHNSWPTGNWTGFMNGHLPGLILLGFLSGYLARLVYGAMVGSKFNPFLLFVYLNTVSLGGTLNLSVYGITGNLARLLTALILLLLVRGATAVILPTPQVARHKAQSGDVVRRR